jgi:hypothetical protein
MGTYLAGLWPHNYHFQLCWYRTNYKYTVDEVASLSKNSLSSSSAYRAPSWSWAAIDSPVTMPTYGHVSDRSAEKYSQDDFHVEKLEVLEASITPESELTKFFKFTAGFIRVRARIQRIKICGSRIFVETLAKATPLVSPEARRIITGSSSSVDQAIFDRQQDEPVETKEFPCLEVLVRKSETVFGLILKRVAGKHTYQRIGLAIMQMRTGLFDESEMPIDVVLV